MVYVFPEISADVGLLIAIWVLGLLSFLTIMSFGHWFGFSDKQSNMGFFVIEFWHDISCFKIQLSNNGIDFKEDGNES